MRKKVFGRKLGRNTNTRKALFRALARDIVLHGSITTTKSKVLAVQPTLEKLMTLTKKGGINGKRRALAMLGNDEKTVDAVFSKKFKALLDSRNSGFTRITTLPPRRGDNTKMAKIEWVIMPTEPEVAKVDKKEAKKATKKESKKETKK